MPRHLAVPAPASRMSPASLLFYLGLAGKTRRGFGRCFADCQAGPLKSLRIGNYPSYSRQGLWVPWSRPRRELWHRGPGHMVPLWVGLQSDRRPGALRRRAEARPTRKQDPLGGISVFSATGRVPSRPHRTGRAKRQHSLGIAGLGPTVRYAADSCLLRRTIRRLPRVASADQPIDACRTIPRGERSVARKRTCDRAAPMSGNGLGQKPPVVRCSLTVWSWRIPDIESGKSVEPPVTKSAFGSL